MLLLLDMVARIFRMFSIAELMVDLMGKETLNFILQICNNQLQIAWKM